MMRSMAPLSSPLAQPAHEVDLPALLEAAHRRPSSPSRRGILRERGDFRSISGPSAVPESPEQGCQSKSKKGPGGCTLRRQARSPRAALARHGRPRPAVQRGADCSEGRGLDPARTERFRHRHARWAPAGDEARGERGRGVCLAVGRAVAAARLGVARLIVAVREAPMAETLERRQRRARERARRKPARGDAAIEVEIEARAVEVL